MKTLNKSIEATVNSLGGFLQRLIATAPHCRRYIQKIMKHSWRIRRIDYTRLLTLSRHETKRDFGREICGFLINNGCFLHLWLTRNKRKKPGGFSYYMGEVKELEKITKSFGIEIVGTFHSHPASEAVPGRNDVKYAENDSLMLIFDCIGNQGRLWHVKDGQYREKKMELI